ncbi:MAG: glycosyltransferase [Erysipelotrichaceae bacterium]|nr:glycosyltransferase [Erysipelotrichaceae bacterium]
MEKLDVCLINDSFPPLIDGVSNAVFNYASIIQKELGNAVVATPELPGVQDDYDFQVLRYPSIDTTKAVGYRTGVPFNPPYLTQFNEQHIDIIHSHCPITSTYLARILREQTKSPIVLTYHTKFDIDIRKAIDSKLLQEVAINALVSNIQAVDEVWAVSRGAGENLKSLGYKGDYIVMHNGVDFTKGASSKKAVEAFRNERGISDGKPIYLFVGRMMWYKGIKIIVDALCELKKHGIDFHMLFIGDGVDRREIQQYIEEKGLTDECIFTGSISDRKVLKTAFSASDLFLFPSTFDTNGIVVREAAAAGLGSVLIRNSCAAEDTLDGVNTIQIEENAESLAKVLIQAGNNTDYFHRIGRNAQRQLYMSWKEAVEQAYERYKVVVEKYEYQPRNPLDISDSFFGMWSDISLAITRAKKNRQDFVRKLRDTAEGIRQTSDMISYRRTEIREYFDDMLDRYL